MIVLMIIIIIIIITVVSGHFYWIQWKKFNRLSALVDNLHLEGKDNLCKKALEFTTLKANLY